MKRVLLQIGRGGGRKEVQLPSQQTPVMAALKVYKGDWSLEKQIVKYVKTKTILNNKIGWKNQFTLTKTYTFLPFIFLKYNTPNFQS